MLLPKFFEPDALFQERVHLCIRIKPFRAIDFSGSACREKIDAWKKAITTNPRRCGPFSNVFVFQASERDQSKGFATSFVQNGNDTYGQDDAVPFQCGVRRHLVLVRQVNIPAPDNMVLFFKRLDDDHGH